MINSRILELMLCMRISQAGAGAVLVGRLPALHQAQRRSRALRVHELCDVVTRSRTRHVKVLRPPTPLAAAAAAAAAGGGGGRMPRRREADQRVERRSRRRHSRVDARPARISARTCCRHVVSSKLTKCFAAARDRRRRRRRRRRPPATALRGDMSRRAEVATATPCTQQRSFRAQIGAVS